MYILRVCEHFLKWSSSISKKLDSWTVLSSKVVSDVVALKICKMYLNATFCSYQLPFACLWTYFFKRSNSIPKSFILEPGSWSQSYKIKRCFFLSVTKIQHWFYAFKVFSCNVYMLMKKTRFNSWGQIEATHNYFLIILITLSSNTLLIKAL